MERTAFALFMICVLVPGSFARDKKSNDESDPAKGVNFYSIEKEIALGQEMAQEVEKQSRIFGDPVVTEYVNRLGQNLVRNSDSKMPFRIKVIDSDEVNAFALPGGFMFVNTGLLLRAEDEAELAGVMAHEVAHVAARHGTKQATRGTIINYATLPLVFLGGWAGVALREAAALALPLGVLHFSRTMEQQADHLGLQYMYRAGYDPNAFVDFFERIESLEKKKPGTISRLFATHPITGSRITHAQRQIQSELKPLDQYVVDTSEFQDVRHRLAAMERLQRKQHDNDTVPVLKRRSPDNVDDADNSGAEDRDRPTLKRRQ
jgi:predicted Zn-dependent protease